MSLPLMRTVCHAAVVAHAAAQIGFGGDAAPVAEESDLNLVMGMGWGLFLVLLLAFLTIIATLVASGTSKAGPIVGVAGGALTIAVLIFLLECPTKSERAVIEAQQVKTDNTAKFRDGVLAIVIVTTLLGAAANAAFAMSLRLPFVPRPKRGLQTHRQYKSAVQASLE